MSPPADTPTPVGQQLADRRDELDLTQESLARRIGITSSTVSATERGRTEIRRSKRPAWEEALQLQAGSISRAYRDGAALEPLEVTPKVLPYADLDDPRERTIWDMKISEDDRRVMIDLLRADRQENQRRA
jgi:transcriptional regulator with XRE-family HTH domain